MPSSSPGVGHAGQLLEPPSVTSRWTAPSSTLSAAAFPFLGICIGMQIMFGDQEEGGATGHRPPPRPRPSPQAGRQGSAQGWNVAKLTRDSHLGVQGEERYYYFVHSFIADDVSVADVVATTSYGEIFPSAVIRDHLWGDSVPSREERRQRHGAAPGLRSDGRRPFTRRCRRGLAVIVYPAIDIRGGRCVRLVEGDFDRETVFDGDPADVASRWRVPAPSGSTLSISMAPRTAVPRTSSRSGHPRPCGHEAPAWRRIPVRRGRRGRPRGGIDRVVLGSAAVSSPELVRDLVARHGDRIAVGLDARDAC
jgi:imidazoleglycerol phosphate synthase glutamine amidotransferase subunit HisH